MVVPPDVYVDVDDRVSDPAVAAPVEVVAVDGFVDSTRHKEIKKCLTKKKIVFVIKTLRTLPKLCKTNVGSEYFIRNNLYCLSNLRFYSCCEFITLWYSENEFLKESFPALLDLITCRPYLITSWYSKYKSSVQIWITKDRFDFVQIIQYIIFTFYR